MKVIRTTTFIDYARSIKKRIIKIIEIEDTNKFIKEKEQSVGFKNIDYVTIEEFDGIMHKITVHQADIDPAGDAERTVVYEWTDRE